MYDFKITAAEAHRIGQWVRGYGTPEMAPVLLTRLPNGALEVRQGDEELIIEHGSQD